MPMPSLHDSRGPVAALHPAIERALDLWPEAGPAGDARPVIGRLLEPLAGDDRAWGSSLLLRTGFPFELSFSSCDPRLRYTIETGPPGVDAAGRLRQAAGLAGQLGGAPPPPDLLDRLARAQSCGEVRYGCWLGLRHGAAGREAKLYAEIPPEGWRTLADWEAALVGRPAILPGRAVSLKIAACTPATGVIELFYQTRGLHPREVSSLLERAGIGSDDEERRILDVLGRACQRDVRRALPSPDFGFSYAIAPAGGVAAFTLYAFANDLFGGDGSIRAAVLRLAAGMGWDLPAYERISAPLSRREGGITHHGMFGITLRPGHTPAVGFGLGPPSS